MSDSTSAPEPQMQVRTVEMPTPDGVLRGKVAVKVGPMSLAALVPTACQLTDGLVARAVRLEVEAGRAISCQAGCGACCRHMVPVSPPEALYLMNVIDSFEPARRSAISERFEQLEKVLDEHGMIAELLDPDVIDAPVLPVARQYFGLGLACPFLVDESCRIYPHRPVACRDYNVTSPPAWCARPYEHDVAKVPMPLPLSVPLAKLAAEITAQKPVLIPLALVPRWVATHADLRTRQWSGPDLFDRFLAHLGCADSCGRARLLPSRGSPGSSPSQDDGLFLNPSM